MLYPEVKMLFKYFTPDRDKIKLLFKNKIYIPKPVKFNDPFDSKLNIIEDNDIRKYAFPYYRSHNLSITDNPDPKIIMLDSDGKIRSEIKEELMNTVHEFNNMMNKCGVLSLTIDKSNILMWSHYTREHTGFCVGFERSGIFSDDLCFPVNYTRYFPTIHVVDFYNSNMAIQHRFGNKSIDWAYENEWRYISQKGDIEIDINTNINSITFGIKADVKLIKNFHSIKKYHPNCIFYKAEVHDNQYQIKFVEIIV
jgi:hypothetical protein